MEDLKFFKAFIRVVKSINADNFYNSFGKENIVKEPLIKARNKAEVKAYLMSEYPQFFQNDKIYEKETKNSAQFFYVVIYELFNYEIEMIKHGKWQCSYCKHEHDNRYISKPRIYPKLFPDIEFCRNDDDTCVNNFKKMYFKDVELPDDEAYIRKDSPIYIYKITEKNTGKCYIGKTKNEPFFRWWNHLKHSSSPFGLHISTTKLSDWSFEVIDMLAPETKDQDAFKTESEYILKYNSIENGFNSLISNKSVNI